MLHLYTAVALTLGEPQNHLEDLLKLAARPRPRDLVVRRGGSGAGIYFPGDAAAGWGN